MAKIIDLPKFNSERIEYKSPGIYIDGTSNTNGSTHIGGTSNTLQFENKYGDNIVITPIELKEHITEFLSNEVNLYADETIREYREQLKRRLDV